MSMPLLEPPLNRPLICPVAGHRKVPAAAPGPGEAVTLADLVEAPLPAAAERVGALRFAWRCALRLAAVDGADDALDEEVAPSARAFEEDEDDEGDAVRVLGVSLGDVPHATTRAQSIAPRPSRPINDPRAEG